MGYMGFQATEASAAKSGARNPAAVAASAGRKKYGAKGFGELGAAGRKNPNRSKAAKAKLASSIQPKAKGLSSPTKTSPDKGDDSRNSSGGGSIYS